MELQGTSQHVRPLPIPRVTKCAGVLAFVVLVLLLLGVISLQTAAVGLGVAVLAVIYDVFRHKDRFNRDVDRRSDPSHPDKKIAA